MKGATKAWHGQSGKTAKKRISCDFPTWDFERRSGDSRVQTIGATQGAHGQSTEISEKLLLYEIGVTPAHHPFFVSKLPPTGKVNFERRAKRKVLGPTVCDSFDV